METSSDDLEGQTGGPISGPHGSTTTKDGRAGPNVTGAWHGGARHVRRPSFVLSVDVPTRSARTVSTTPNDQRIEQAWIANHAHLTNLAYRMLGDIGAAED